MLTDAKAAIRRQPGSIGRACAYKSGMELESASSRNSLCA